MKKSFISRLCLILLFSLFLAACGGAEAPDEATGEAVEEIEKETAEEAVEEPAVEEAEEEMAEEEPAPPEAIGSEAAGGELPPPPDTGTKVDRVDASDETAVAEADAPARVEEAEADTVPADSEESAAVPEGASLTLDQNSRLTAGEVDDNAEWDDYLLYLRNYSGAAVMEVDVSERHLIHVIDSQENPVLAARIDIEANQQHITTLRTHSDGLAYFFPRAFAASASDYTVNVSVNGQTESFTIPATGSQREWFVIHPGADQSAATTQLDILFLIDATGSMADEINELKENIQFISAQIDEMPAQPNVRFGLVTYRDRGDEYLTDVIDFTPDINEFEPALDAVIADGGGDYPEDLNEALSQAVHTTEWRVENTVSLIFLVADAPPHLDYGQQNHYAVEMLEAAERGIKIYPIASSGLDAQGEYVFRQLAQVTGGRFIFLTYGADGPGTPGTETDFDVSDYTVSSLDTLVIRIVEEELSYLNR